MKPRVLFEDNHLLVVDKPAGLLAQADRTGDPSLVDVAKQYRIEHENKPGQAYIGLVHRLDRPVSGIVVLAKTSKAAARLSEQWRTRAVRKIYLAITDAGRKRSGPAPAGETWQDTLDRPEASGAKSSSAPRRHSATTKCRLLARAGRWLLLELEPITGRKHQLRQQCAQHGWIIVGDRRYGSSESFPSGIALHAAEIHFDHPTLHEPVVVTSLPPATWKPYGFAEPLSAWKKAPRLIDRGTLKGEAET